MKMIIADDEPVITRGICKILDWKSLGIEIAAAYADGKSAFEGILRIKPELALLDISMPDMTGIEILKECHRLGIATQIIFISGFQDFEYAKDALRYGAVEYLLKPIIREELMNALEKCFVNLPDKKGEIFGENEEERQVDYGKLVELEDTTYTPVYVEIFHKQGEDEQMKKLARFSFISYLESYLETKDIGITFMKREHIVIVLKGMDDEKSHETIEELWKSALEKLKCHTAYIIGKCVGSMSDIPEAFQECLSIRNRLFFADEMQVPIFHAGTELYTRKIEGWEYAQIQENLVSAVIGLDKAKFEQAFERFKKAVLYLSEGKKEDACYYFCSAVKRAEERMAETGTIEEDLAIKDLLRAGRETQCYRELCDIFYGCFSEYQNRIRQAMFDDDKQNFIKAKSYIEKHYMEPLTLNILADEIHMNPYYFSVYFKKNAGENFKDYVRRIRLEHALPFLVSTNKKTYEIALEVGFVDVRSFSKAFQKLYRETPNEYRRRIREGQREGAQDNQETAGKE